MYKEEILKQAARLMSLQDRDEFSITSGCFDRNYWQWKFVDFSCPALQQGVYALSYLYSYPGTVYHNNLKLKKWASAGIKYLIKRQHRDGSFDEAYPHEHSLAATAVSSFYVAESLKLIGPDKEAEKALEKSGNWLLNNDETHGFLSNHLASAAAALYHIYLITEEEKYLKRAEYFINKIKDHQSEEGWFEEYGGADPGYQTLTVFYLARYWQLSRNEEVLSMLRKSMDFLIYCIHPNGTIGGEYGSRNTEFFFPAGFEILSEKIGKAKIIASRIRMNSLAAVDIYNFILMFNNYLFALSNKKDIQAEDDFFSSNFSKFFDGAGLFFKNTPNYYCIIGTSKGGVIKVFSQGKLRYSNAGWIGKIANNWVITTQWLVQGRRVDVDDNRLLIKGSFYKKPEKIFSPRLFIMFRMFMALAGLFKPLRYFIKNVIVRVLIKEERKVGAEFEREIRFSDNDIYVRDKLINKGVNFEYLKVSDKFTSIHMGSSKYFNLSELDSEPPTNQDFSEEINNKGEIVYEDSKSY